MMFQLCKLYSTGPHRGIQLARIGHLRRTLLDVSVAREQDSWVRIYFSCSKEQPLAFALHLFGVSMVLTMLETVDSDWREYW